VISGDEPILFARHMDVDAELKRLRERLGRDAQAALPQRASSPSSFLD
jgi:hypothetical protein